MKTEEILSRLLDGEHVEINEYEIFVTYAGGYWIRREMTAEEMEKEGFEELGCYQEDFVELSKVEDKLNK